MRYEIHKIDVWPAVRMAFFLSALLGFLLGLASSMVFLLFSGLLRTVLPGEVVGQAGSVLAPLTILLTLVWAPVYGAFGALLATLGVFLYNLIIRWTGGITVRLKEMPSPVTKHFPMDVSSDG